jgi:ATP-dependent DNA helicase RecQ
VRERWGARHVAEVLKGANTEKIRQNGHDQLSTHGLLAAYTVNDIQDWVDQLITQGFLVREGEYQLLRMTEEGRRLMKGEGQVRLTLPRQVEKAPKAKKAGSNDVSLSPAEEAVFEGLRAWRREIAKERGVPPYVILNDATLRDLAHARPAHMEALLMVKGIGESKARAFGEDLLAVVASQAQAQGLQLGGSLAVPRAKSSLGPVPAAPAVAAVQAQAASATSRSQRDAAFQAFRDGLPLEEVAAATGRALSTVEGYLMEFIQEESVDTPEPWVPRETFERVIAAAAEIQAERLKPIHEALNGEVSYVQIRLALAIRANALG